MTRVEGSTYHADIEWDKDGKPVMYVVGHGSISLAKDAFSVLAVAVKMVDEGPFKHVCSVYNMLDVAHLPHMARFIGSGRVPSSVKTAHIILGTISTELQLFGALVAVANSKRLRTMEVQKTQEEIDQAVIRWLNLPDRAREYTVDNV